MKERFFDRGRCLKCATSVCNEYCLHYGALVCRRTLKQIGEEFYMKGMDEFGVKYYTMAVLAEMTSGIVPTLGHASTAARPTFCCVPHDRFESIEDRYRRQQKNEEFRRQHARFRGIFGPFAHKPVDRSAALSFQRGK